MRHSLEACCLDVEWLNDFTFASGGSDRVIHIVSLYSTKSLYALRFVVILCSLSTHPHRFPTGAILAS